jgi:squalene synthase HpnC
MSASPLQTPNSRSYASDHYENFPVASILLPAKLRRPVAIIYAFARSADDFADEGDVPAATRLDNLNRYDAELIRIARGEPPESALFQDLATVIADYRLPIGLFHDLIDAFKQDVSQTRYADFAMLMDYCRRSADPVGRLMLHLFDRATPDNLRMSDQICSALQLINHWQDVAIDWQKNVTGRVYLPQDDLSRFGLSDADIAKGVATPAWRDMMRFQTDRARAMMLSGKPLAMTMPGRFGMELRMIVRGGLTILDKIDAVDGDVFRHRPTLTKWDFLRMAPGALLKTF